MPRYTRQLAAFCSGLRFDAIPAPVVNRIKWLILDNLGVIVGAAPLDVSRRLARFAQGLAEREEASILCFGTRSSARTAALVNGSLAEMVEMQDGYTKGGYHPSCGTISAALAMAESHKQDGRTLLTSVVAGYEVGNRVAEAIHPTHLSRGFQPTGTAGTIGAAAAVAHALGLDEEHTFNALGIAAFILPISTGDNLWGGYSIKPIHGGAAARSGIESVLLAQLDLTAAPLEGDARVQKGFCRIVSDEPPRFEAMTDGLGERYTIGDVYLKPYASCRANQGAVEIALDLRTRCRLDHRDIAEVLIKTYDFAARRTGSVITDTNSPFTLCQFSMPYAVAGALMAGEVGLQQFTEAAVRNPDIHALAARITVVADPELQKAYLPARPTAMEITLQDGTRLTGRVDFPKGDARNPMTEQELLAKFTDLTVDVLGAAQSRAVLDCVLDLEHLDSMDTLIRHLVSPRAPSLSGAAMPGRDIADTQRPSQGRQEEH